MQECCFIKFTSLVMIICFQKGSHILNPFFFLILISHLLHLLFRIILVPLLFKHQILLLIFLCILIVHLHLYLPIFLLSPTLLSSYPYLLASSSTLVPLPSHDYQKRVFRPFDRYGVLALQFHSHGWYFTPVPKTYAEALKFVHGKEWNDNMDAEFDALIANGTWELRLLPQGR